LIGGGPFTAQHDFRFAFNESSPSQQAPAMSGSTGMRPAVPTSKPHSAKTIGGSWQPSEDAVRQLTQLGVTREFAQQQFLSLLAIGANAMYRATAGSQNILKKSGDSGSRPKQPIIEDAKKCPSLEIGDPQLTLLTS
jgi:hypothetical protein